MPGPSCVIAASEGSDIVGANRHRLPWTMSLFWVPSFALSLHIEAERPEQNYLSTRAANGLLAASQFVSGFFALESRLCAALHHELVLRGADGPISSTTLRTLDSVLYASVASPDPRSATLDKVSRHGPPQEAAHPLQRDQYYSRVGNGDVGDLAYTLALESGLAPTGDVGLSATRPVLIQEQTYDLLVTSLTRILNSYALCEVVALRSLVPCVPGQDDALLRRLWSLYKPDTPLVALKSKQWQDLGFQNDHPSTDVRGVGMLALDALIYFAEAYPSDVVEKVLQESVEGGEHWYPFALASITITKYAYVSLH